jgi:hypothetical protein
VTSTPTVSCRIDAAGAFAPTVKVISGAPGVESPVKGTLGRIRHSKLATVDLFAVQALQNALRLLKRCTTLRQLRKLVSNRAKRCVVGLQRTFRMLSYHSEQIMLERLNCTDVVIMYVFALLRLIVDESNEERSVIPGSATFVSKALLEVMNVSLPQQHQQTGL